MSGIKRAAQPVLKLATEKEKTPELAAIVAATEAIAEAEDKARRLAAELERSFQSLPPFKGTPPLRFDLYDGLIETHRQMMEAYAAMRDAESRQAAAAVEKVRNSKPFSERHELTHATNDNE